MGTAAALYREGDIPGDKKEEFITRMEMLLQAGGMMECNWIEMCGKELVTLKKVTMCDDEVEFDYNYFEDDIWEDAGFNKDACCVWSQKIGYKHFYEAIIAAYTLEELYADGPAVVMDNFGLITLHNYTGWINYLFQEHFSPKNRDPWPLFEIMHEWSGINMESCRWEKFAFDIYGVIGAIEIRSVLTDTDTVLQRFMTLATEEQVKRMNEENSYINAVIKVKRMIGEYHQENVLSTEEQLSLLLRLYRLSFEQDTPCVDKSQKDEKLKEILNYMFNLDAAALVVKILAETYKKDFWELWTQIKDVARRRWIYAEETVEAPPISTAKFFEQDPDDMILFWEDDGKIRFSKELKKWFDDLSDRYDELMRIEFTVENPLEWILDLMEYADENYYQVYTIDDFFEETLEHLMDIRYLSLWKIYDEMLHDPELEEAGSVIFVPDGPEYEHVGLFYFEPRPRRRLLKEWKSMGIEEKNNKARVTLRRYMALVANKKLRKEVFGF